MAKQRFRDVKQGKQQEETPKKVKKQIYHILNVFLHDNVKARKLNREGFYDKIAEGSKKVNAQATFMKEYAKKDNKTIEDY